MVNRRQFLKIGGSTLIGVAFAGGVGSFLWKMFTNPADLFHGDKKKTGDIGTDEKVDFQSPYRRTFGFVAPDEINAFEVCEGKIILATQNNIYLYNMAGQEEKNFSVPSDVRDIAFYKDNIYLLFASRIEVYSIEGDMIRDWAACSDDSDYCSFTVFDGGVFVTDATNKNICKYNLDGTLSCFIKSPEGFIVPSYSFGITNNDGYVYCSNPGRHKIEVYDKEGKFVRSFGKSGNAAGEFCGCCNPVYITCNGSGEIITSEKGIPRISCYTTDGKFRSILLNDKMLGGGHNAYDMKVYKDKLIVAGGKKVQVFQYNSKLADKTLCGDCNVDCPMKPL